MKNHDFQPMSRFISEIIQARAILTMTDQWKVVLWSIKRRYFQWPWTTPNPI